MRFEIPTDAEKVKDIETLERSDIRKPPITVEQLEDICSGNEELEEMLARMLDQCYAYAITVAKFKQIALESKGTMSEALVSIDALRRSTHDSTIDAINAFSRILARENKDNSWMAGVVGDRTLYTRFALTLILDHIKRSHSLAR